MANVTNKLVIEADPKQPVAEIGNIITAFLQLWPGSEELILQGVRAEIDRALAQIATSNQNQALNPVLAANRPPNRRDRRQQKNNRR